MLAGEILVKIFPVEHIIYIELEGKILVQFIGRTQIEQEVRVAVPEMAAPVSHAFFSAVGDEHAVSIEGEGIFVEGSTEMKQMLRDVMIVLPFNMPHLSGVIQVGGPVLAEPVVQGQFKAMGLGVAYILIIIYSSIT